MHSKHFVENPGEQGVSEDDFYRRVVDSRIKVVVDLRAITRSGATPATSGCHTNRGALLATRITKTINGADL